MQLAIPPDSVSRVLTEVSKPSDVVTSSAGELDICSLMDIVWEVEGQGWQVPEQRSKTIWGDLGGGLKSYTSVQIMGAQQKNAKQT